MPLLQKKALHHLLRDQHAPAVDLLLRFFVPVCFVADLGCAFDQVLGLRRGHAVQPNGVARLAEDAQDAHHELGDDAVYELLRDLEERRAARLGAEPVHADHDCPRAVLDALLDDERVDELQPHPNEPVVGEALRLQVALQQAYLAHRDWEVERRLEVLCDLHSQC